MELKELTEQTLSLFGAKKVSELGDKLFNCAVKGDKEKMNAFCALVENDLTVDWLQMIYQYYLAEREHKKQDYTPKSLAILLSELIGESDITIDMCAGSGALTIQRWNHYPNMKFELYEVDENVIPYLIFNMVIRNINAIVHQSDVLQQEIKQTWEIKQGEQYGKVVDFKSTV